MYRSHVLTSISPISSGPPASKTRSHINFYGLITHIIISSYEHHVITFRIDKVVKWGQFNVTHFCVVVNYIIIHLR